MTAKRTKRAGVEIDDGVEIRHGLACGFRQRKACDCRPGVRSRVVVDGRSLRKSFNGRELGNTGDRVGAAKKWRIDAESAMRHGTTLPAAGADTFEGTVEGLVEKFLTGAEKGHIKGRKGQAYAPSTLRRMRQAVECRIIPKFGDRDPDTLTADELERFVEELNEQGLSASSVQNAIKPLAATYRWACRTRRVRGGNPTVGLQLPSGGGTRERIAMPDEAAALLDALPDDDRVLWAIAFYGGLRRSEVLGLRWEDLDTDSRRLHVRKTYHLETGTLRDIGKSKAALRTVPMPGLLVPELARHALRTGRRSGFVIGGEAPGGVPHWTMFLSDAYEAWSAAGLQKLCFHEARHTYASWIVAAAVRSGEAVDWKELAVFMGHKDIAWTIEKYQKLLPDNLERAGARLDRFLDEYAHADTV